MQNSISVIIPVLNEAETLNRVLSSLSEQSYPNECIEIILIDNGSTDDTLLIAKNYDVKVLSELELKSPYAARNKGLEIATGAIVAFTDANKIPDKDWVREGVNALLSESADLVGGNILFDLGDSPTIAEVYDAMIFNNNRKLVLEEGGSATGNLFARRAVFEKLGNFPNKYRSGMDMWWSQQAVREGYKLVFSEKSIVWCKPRKLKSLLKKSFRIGTMFKFVNRQNGKSTGHILQHTVQTFAPPKLTFLKERNSSIGRSDSLFYLFIIAWLSKIYMGIGRIRSLLFRFNEK